MEKQLAAPSKSLSVLDAIAIVVGIVIGAGIFGTPPNVANSVPSTAMFILLWIVGGLISLIGALCYAELATTYPHAGGDYFYLQRALGSPFAFLFAWARMTVIQTGSIALQAFVFGAYATRIASLGTHSAAIYASAAVLILTVVNVAGLVIGKWAQNLMTLGVVAALLAIASIGIIAPATAAPATSPATHTPFLPLGLGMVFVLLTYGGWNEAAYLSAEVRGGRRGILHVLIWGTVIITGVYVLTNLGYIAGLGLTGVAASQAVAADVLRQTFGDKAAFAMSLVVVLASLSTMNGTIITGGRTTYAMGRDYPAFAPLGRWRERSNSPVNALLLQCLLTLALVLLGAFTREGFDTMVAYTSPVFWTFFLLVGVCLFVLRFKDRDTERPFRVPLYPLTPILFCAACVYMLQSSLRYAYSLGAAGMGAWIGVAVLFLGVPLIAFVRPAAERRGLP